MIIKTPEGWARLIPSEPMKFLPPPWPEYSGHHSVEEIRLRDVTRQVFVTEQQVILDTAHANSEAKYLQELNS